MKQKEEMRVCIVTIIGYTNYGNRLQNYALCRILESMGAVVCSGLRCNVKSKYINEIDKEQKNSLISRPLANIKKQVASVCDWQLYLKFRDLYAFLRRNLYTSIRIARFKRHTRHTLRVLPDLCVNTYDDIIKQEGLKEIDIFVVGSDQVWNPRYLDPEISFLRFANGRKRLSFAASIGVDKGLALDSRFVDGVNSMDYISVREATAACLLREATTKEVNVCLDPTFLLEKRCWIEYESKPGFRLNKRFIIVFFLGRVPPSVEEYIKKTDLQVVRLNDKRYFRQYIVNPAEFVWLFHNADLVFTDSFHGTAFSLIFHRNFYAYKRKQKNMENMFSRIHDVLNQFDFTDRQMEPGEQVDDKEILCERWISFENTLSCLRKSMLGSFRRALLDTSD